MIRTLLGIVTAAVLAVPLQAQWQNVSTAVNLAQDVEPGVEIQQQGPIHEGFAQPGAETRGKGMTAPKAPPPQIEEVPPESKPEGENVRWVPGYWSWDADRKDFLWVSGFWRNTPEGRAWNPGEWKKQANGEYQYIPGFWKPADLSSRRVDLPEPPESIEIGPNMPPHNPDSIWIPGGWEYRNEKYLWRPGYWATPNGDMCWQPSQYLATDHGYCYVPGYWDYPLERRGLLFASVAFSRPLWAQPGWRYQPRFAFGVGLGGGWGLGGFYDGLFIGPGRNSYYFGAGWNSRTGWSYAGGIGFQAYGWGGIPVGVGIGFQRWQPWFTTSRGYSNPLWNHYVWLNRGTPHWQSSVRTTYVARSLGSPVSSQVVYQVTSQRITETRGAVSGLAAVSGQRPGTVTVKPGSPTYRTPSSPVIQPANLVVRSMTSASANRPESRPQEFRSPNVSRSQPDRPSMPRNSSNPPSFPSTRSDLGSNARTIRPDSGVPNLKPNQPSAGPMPNSRPSAPRVSPPAQPPAKPSAPPPRIQSPPPRSSAPIAPPSKPPSGGGSRPGKGKSA